MVLPPGYSLCLFFYKPFMWCRSDARLRHACYLFIVYDYGTFGLWSLLLWTNHLFYVYYWVSLGRFYLLDIRCDYSLLSPFCGVAPTPDCGIIILAVSSRGVIQTLVWHQYYYFYIFRSRSHSDTRLAPVLLFLHFPLEESFRHSFGTQYFILVYFYPYVCIIFFFVYFVTDVWSHSNPGRDWYIISVFLMFASTFKRTHWLVPGYCLGQIPRLERSDAMPAPKPTQWR